MTNRTDNPPPPASTRVNWASVQAVAPQAAVLAVVGIATTITMTVSYWHEYLLAHRNGQARWVSALVPVSIDGIVLVSAVALLWAAAHNIKKWRQLWRPVLWLAVGVLVTISANFFSDLTYRWIGPGVSASSGVALILISDVAFWLLAESRKLANGDEPQPAANCSCPPPPLTVAEALPLARARLRDAGEPHGEQVLADRFGITRDRVRKLQSPQLPDPSLNGSGS